MAKKPKNVINGYRITGGGSILLDSLASVCMDYSLILNGDAGVSKSALLTHIWEKADESDPATKQPFLLSVLRMMDLKFKNGKPIDEETRQLIIKKVLQHGI